MSNKKQYRLDKEPIIYLCPSEHEEMGQVV